MGIVSDRALEISVVYEGPWERLASWLWAIDPAGEPRHVIRAGCLRDRLACRAERRDKMWAYRYALHGTRPHPRWKRRPLRSPVSDGDLEHA